MESMASAVELSHDDDARDGIVLSRDVSQDDGGAMGGKDAVGGGILNGQPDQVDVGDPIDHDEAVELRADRLPSAPLRHR